MNLFYPFGVLVEKGFPGIQHFVPKRKAPGMENKTGRKKFRRDLPIIAALLFLYGVLLFSLDPEWVQWAGAMSIGVLYTGDMLPPAIFSQPLEAVRMASLSGLLTLCALALLLDILEEPRR